MRRGRVDVSIMWCRGVAPLFPGCQETPLIRAKLTGVHVNGQWDTDLVYGKFEDVKSGEEAAWV